MSKNEDIDIGFKVGDSIKSKSGFIGKIARFEWNGGIRSVLVPSGKSNKSLYIFPIGEIERMPVELEIPIAPEGK